MNIEYGRLQYQRAHHQGFRRHAYIKVMMQNIDITDALLPFLLSVRVRDVLYGMDQCVIEIDDRDAILPIPPDNISIVVHMGWAGQGPRLPLFRRPGVNLDQFPQASDIPPNELPWEQSGSLLLFQGALLSIESSFGRKQGGRRLFIEAGPPQKHEAKSHNMNTYSDHPNVVSLQKAMQQAAPSGMNVMVAPELANVGRQSWFQNESFFQFGARVANEIGAFFRITGNTAIFTAATSGTNIYGQLMPVVEAYWGVNLLRWRIKPFVARPQYGSARNDYFSVVDGVWRRATEAIGGDNPFGFATAAAGRPAGASNRRIGEQLNGSMSADSQIQRGTGWAIINGEPSAVAGATMLISGARPGVDGSYLIEEAEHTYRRGGDGAGYTTRCKLTMARPRKVDYQNVPNPQTPQGFVAPNQFPGV